MRFRTRAFLFCFFPLALLLGVSFWMTQRLVQSAVREQLRASLRENHLAVARVRSQSDLQNSRFLKIAGENPALKAGMQLVLSERGSPAARATVEDQLREQCEQMGFDFLLVSAADGVPLAGVLRADGQLAPVDVSHMTPAGGGLSILNGRPFQIASVPVDQAGENLGTLSVGEPFDFSEFTAPVVLIHDGAVIHSTLAGIAPAEVEASLSGCDPEAECDIRLQGAAFISLPMHGVFEGRGYLLRSVQNADTAAAPVQAQLKNIFLLVSLGAALGALAFSYASSRSIVRPISEVVSRLTAAGPQGLLPEFGSELSSIREIRELCESFDRAAVSVRDARENLQNAYIEFVESLASALDARDGYTAGHSQRVSRLSCATAAAMKLPAPELERIRVGALLHDIGKIGIADAVLRKGTNLTSEEFALVKLHPEIGRRILEGVHGFAPYLAAVELHHENWDGTGYPRGQAGEQTPLDARIIHVADAYDAMTTDRPYRRGMRHDQAVHQLRQNAGTQFDPAVVEAFIGLPHADTAAQQAVHEATVC